MKARWDVCPNSLFCIADIIENVSIPLSLLMYVNSLIIFNDISIYISIFFLRTSASVSTWVTTSYWFLSWSLSVHLLQDNVQIWRRTVYFFLRFFVVPIKISSFYCRHQWKYLHNTAVMWSACTVLCTAGSWFVNVASTAMIIQAIVTIIQVYHYPVLYMRKKKLLIKTKIIRSII